MELSSIKRSPILAPPPSPTKVEEGKSRAILAGMVPLYLASLGIAVVGWSTGIVVLSSIALVLGVAGLFAQSFFTIKFLKAARENVKQITERTLNWESNELYPYLKSVYGIEAGNQIDVDGITVATKDGEPISVRIEGIKFYETSHFGAAATGPSDIYNYIYAEIDYSKLGVSTHQPATFTPLQKLV